MCVCVCVCVCMCRCVCVCEISGFVFSDMSRQAASVIEFMFLY